MRGIALHWQILIALALAALAGALVGEQTTLFAIPLVSVFDFIGTLFINALQMLIVPLVVSSIIVGIAGIGGAGQLGRLGGKTLAFYAVTSISAILIGLILVNVVSPGVQDGQPVRAELGLEAAASQVQADLADRSVGDVARVFERMIPTNVFAAAADTQMLGLIFFSLLFGFFMTKLGDDTAGTLYTFWNAVFEVMMRMTEWVMAFAPIGVFGLVATVVARTGFSAVRPLAVFAVTVVAALAVHVAVTLPVLLTLVARVNPLRFYRAMAPALLTAFSTASSSGTLPLTMRCLERNVGVSNRTTSFVLPLGATVNMDGTALYECVAAMFLAQAYGIELGFGTQFLIVLTALVTSIGVAGIPSASLVAIAIILKAVGLPVEAIGVLYVFDRVLDMLRTSVNVLGDASCAVSVARLQGEEGIFNQKQISADGEVLERGAAY